MTDDYICVFQGAFLRMGWDGIGYRDLGLHWGLFCLSLLSLPCWRGHGKIHSTSDSELILPTLLEFFFFAVFSLAFDRYPEYIFVVFLKIYN